MSEFPRSLGAYTLERELGRGGMGVVYLATDPRLNRQVAIKVLPDEVARDPQRLARFEREARLLAALKHPNIGGIHGLEEADGQRFLVLEHLEGQTLARRLDGGPLRVNEAIHVCRQIAAALEAAHESGIIHRDLKPGNVMITDDDEIKVLDFGLAKGDGATADSNSDLSASPTVTVGATSAGVILGTAAYMSPEQARGRGLDRRTDIWSFGCVLYECLSGKQLFAGETVSDTIAKILEREPDWEALPKETPDRIRELLRRCLEKKARERLRDIGDARIELDEIESGKTSSISGMTAGVPLAEHRRKVRLAWGAAAIVAVVAVAVARLFFSGPATGREPLMRLEATIPEGILVTLQSDFIAISPDGTRIVFVGTDAKGITQLYLRDLSSTDVTPIPGTVEAVNPFWSPDSRRIGFFNGAKLRTSAPEGGAVETLADVTSPRGGSWGRDYIVFAGAQGPIYRVPIEGGDVETVTVIDTAAGHTAHRFPEFLPDGKRFMYSVLPPTAGQLKVFLSDVDGGEPRQIMEAFNRPVYAEPGYLLWQRGSRIVAQPFDAGSAKLSGKPFAVGPGSRRASNMGSPPVSVSNTGAIVQLPPFTWRHRIEWWDANGRLVERLPLDERGYTAFDLSPDGKRLVVTINENDFESDLWLIDMERMTPTRITFGPGTSYVPYWSPDGRRIFYSSNYRGPIELFVKELDNLNSDSLFVRSDAMFKNAMGWSPDASYVMFARAGARTGMDLWIADVSKEGGDARPLLASPYNEGNVAVSPDGRWCAYDSDESGQTEVYVTTFPRPGPKYRVSTEGGSTPAWRFDGRELYFRSADSWMMRVPVRTGERFDAGTPSRAFEIPPNLAWFAPSPLDDRFLVTLAAEDGPVRGLQVVTGWQGAAETE